MIANVALDYTEWAPPLRPEAILADIQCHQAQSCRTPSKIILWVHQWDYLIKKYEPKPVSLFRWDVDNPPQEVCLQPKYVVEKLEIDDIGLRATLRPAESSDGGRLWGIPVEVRDPEEHKP